MAVITTSPSAMPVHQPVDTYGALFWISFALVLIVACAAQLLFLDWRSWLPGAEGERSLFRAVRAGVYTFMSHLT